MVLQSANGEPAWPNLLSARGGAVDSSGSGDVSTGDGPLKYFQFLPATTLLNKKLDQIRDIPHVKNIQWSRSVRQTRETPVKDWTLLFLLADKIIFSLQQPVP